MHSLTASPWQGKVSEGAAYFLQDYSTDKKLDPKTLTLKVKKEVWVAAWALGYIDLTKSLFSEKKICSEAFGPTIRKLTDWLDLESDKEKIFNILTQIAKVNKSSKEIFAYTCDCLDYSLGNKVTKELCRYSSKWGRLIKEWHTESRKPDSPYFIGGPYHFKSINLNIMEQRRNEEKNLWVSLFSLYGNSEKTEIAIKTQGLILKKEKDSDNNPPYVITEILKSSKLWHGNVTQEAEVILEKYLNACELPKKDLPRELKEELWIAAFALGQCHLMKFLFDYREMDKPEFGPILARAVERVDLNSLFELAMLPLLILAQAHDSTFERDFETWTIGLSFQEFLATHDHYLGKLFDVWWKFAIQGQIRIERPNNDRFDFYKKNAPLFFQPDRACRPSDLAELFKEIRLSIKRIPIILEPLKTFSSNPESIEGLILKKRFKISEELTKCLIEVTNSNKYNNGIFSEKSNPAYFLKAPPGTLSELLEVANEFGLDLLLEHLKDRAQSLGYEKIEKLPKKEVCRELMEVLRPKKFYMNDSTWIDYIPCVKYLYSNATVFNGIESKEPLKRVTHLEIPQEYLLCRPWSPNMSILRDVFPKVHSIEFNEYVRFDESLPRSIKTLMITGYPMGDRFERESLIGLEKQNFVRKLILVHGVSSWKVKEEDDCSEKVFTEIASMPKLEELYIALPEKVDINVFDLFKQSKKLKKIFVDRNHLKIQKLVGESIKVEKWDCSDRILSLKIDMFS